MDHDNAENSQHDCKFGIVSAVGVEENLILTRRKMRRKDIVVITHSVFHDYNDAYKTRKSFNAAAAEALQERRCETFIIATARDAL